MNRLIFLSLLFFSLFSFSTPQENALETLEQALPWYLEYEKKNVYLRTHLSQNHKKRQFFKIQNVSPSMLLNRILNYEVISSKEDFHNFKKSIGLENTEESLETFKARNLVMMKLYSHSTHIVWDQDDPLFRPFYFKKGFYGPLLYSLIRELALKKTHPLYTFLPEILASPIGGKGLGTTFRGTTPLHPLEKKDVFLIPVHGFLNSEEFYKHAYKKRHLKSPEEWIKKEYIPKLAEVHSHQLFELGLWIEAHTQNTLMYYNKRTGKVERFVFRDHEDALLNSQFWLSSNLTVNKNHLLRIKQHFLPSIMGDIMGLKSDFNRGHIRTNIPIIYPMEYTTYIYDHFEYLRLTKQKRISYSKNYALLIHFLFELKRITEKRYGFQFLNEEGVTIRTKKRFVEYLEGLGLNKSVFKKSFIKEDVFDFLDFLEGFVGQVQKRKLTVLSKKSKITHVLKGQAAARFYKRNHFLFWDYRKERLPSLKGKSLKLYILNHAILVKFKGKEESRWQWLGILDKSLLKARDRKLIQSLKPRKKAGSCLKLFM